MRIARVLAHVGQKNWSVVRRLVGYDRYTSEAAMGQLRRLYSLLSHYVNFFQPVMKLAHKNRNGARVHKTYDQARTPYQRLLDYMVPDYVHVLADGKIVQSGDKSLALELEEKGYAWLT